MPKKMGIVFVILGAVLMMSSLLLFLNNEAIDANAGKESGEVLTQIKAEELIVPENTVSTESTGETEPLGEPEPIDPTMTVKVINGYGYIGYLTIPKLELELPVMDDWDYDRLNIAPCRHFGSTKTDDLVIAAHNYDTHFGRLKTLEIGDQVSFTDMDGVVSNYQIVRTGTLHPDAVDAVQYSENHLVLYTCTYGGEERVAVFCDRVVG